jgi:hypothetical protein
VPYGFPHSMRVSGTVLPCSRGSLIENGSWFVKTMFLLQKSAASELVLSDRITF